MSDSAAMKSLEGYLQALPAADWQLLADCLAEEVERSGPYLDVVRGKQAYANFLSGVIGGLRDYELKVLRIRELDGPSAVVELSETLDVGGVRTEFPELLLFDFDEEGKILRVDIYIKQPPGPDRPRESQERKP